ncbi:hypothetical protein XE88_c11935 [Vibrio parahaemolyticus]|nr:hypothetical protein XE88_c11935 [Vibrio parahaemolyticus]
MLEDTLLAIHQVLEQLQGRVIPASLNETRNLLTTHWKMAITLELHSTRWVAPESPRPSLFRVTVLNKNAAHSKVIGIHFPFPASARFNSTPRS